MDTPAVLYTIDRTARHDYYGGHHHDDDGHYGGRNFCCRRTDARGTLGGVLTVHARIGTKLHLRYLAQAALSVGRRRPPRPPFVGVATE